MVKLRIDGRSMQSVQQMIRGMPDQVVAKAFRHSANRAASSGKTFAAREIGKTLKLNKDRIKDGILVDQARGSEIRNLSAGIRFQHKPLPLSYFNPVQEKDGVRVTIKKSSKLIRGAFLATMKSGHVGVFLRARQRGGDQSKRVPITLKSGMKSNKELPISQRFTTSIAEMASNLPVNTAIKTRMTEIFAKNFPTDLKHYLSKMKR